MITRPFFSAALALALSACVPVTPPYLAAPADPNIGTETPPYAAVTGDVASYDVVDPLDWRELNRRVAPKGALDGGDSARPGR